MALAYVCAVIILTIDLIPYTLSMRTITFNLQNESFTVSDDPDGVLSYYLASVARATVSEPPDFKERNLSIDEIMALFAPDGPGWRNPIQGARRMLEPDDSSRQNWHLTNPEFQLPDFTVEEWWHVHVDPQGFEIELEGEELRSLVRQTTEWYHSLLPPPPSEKEIFQASLMRKGQYFLFLFIIPCLVRIAFHTISMNWSLNLASMTTFLYILYNAIVNGKFNFFSLLWIYAVIIATSICDVLIDFFPR